MPIYSYLCDCGHYQEDISSVSNMKDFVVCNECGQIAKKIIAPSKHYTGNQDAAWVRNCLGIFNKGDSDPTVKKAFDTPTKANIQAALKKKGYDIHEKGNKPNHRATSEEYINESHPRFMRRWMEMNRVEVR